MANSTLLSALKTRAQCVDAYGVLQRPTAPKTCGVQVLVTGRTVAGADRQRVGGVFPTSSKDKLASIAMPESQRAARCRRACEATRSSHNAPDIIEYAPMQAARPTPPAIIRPAIPKFLTASLKSVVLYLPPEFAPPFAWYKSYRIHKQKKAHRRKKGVGYGKGTGAKPTNNKPQRFVYIARGTSGGIRYLVV